MSFYSLLVSAATAGVVGTAVVYAVALVGALTHYAAACRREMSRPSLSDFATHLVPSELIWSRWTRLDIVIFVINRFGLALLMPSAATLVALIATGMQTALIACALPQGAMPHNPAWMILFLGCGLVLRDFAAFYTHLMQHRVSVLWEFHKVHHAPESLIPPTGHRIHPVEQLINLATESLLLGLLVGLFAWLTALDQATLITYAVGMYVIVNTLTLSPLRHSHIDLRLGPAEWLFMSPAHHQLHHSAETEHRDKNFGTIFPVWDRIWKTHAVPPTKPYRMGLSAQQGGEYAGVVSAYWTPFKRLAALPAIKIRPIHSSGSSTISKRERRQKKG